MMQKKIRFINDKVENILNYIKLNKTYFDILAKGLLLVAGVLFLFYAGFLAIQANTSLIFLRYVFFGLALVAFTIFANWVLSKLINISKLFRASFIISVALLIIVTEKISILAFFIFCMIILGTTLMHIIRKGRFNTFSLLKKGSVILTSIIFLIFCISATLFFYTNGLKIPVGRNAALLSDIQIKHIAEKSSSTIGSFSVKELTYGSGNDKHRKAYGSNVNIKTPSIDCSDFIEKWSGFSGWWRTHYWGFDQSELPLNARVWYPDAEGRFPLVLIVHGDHYMQDYSDSGYAYIGKLLASRGYVVASVDQNFVNVIWSYRSGTLFEENDARAILLLEHLKLWHIWNEDSQSVFYNKIDTNYIGLIGHSKGGEAISHAALFNTLPYYPDDASIGFNYNYNIKSLVALGAVDAQYKPSKRKANLENINYLALHGTYDSQIESFMALNQLERIRFNDSSYHFKSALYIHGVDHNQFNTSWGRKDSFIPFPGLKNTEPLMTRDDQQIVAKVYISAFLDVTLKNKTSYLPLFIDYKTGNDWLPEAIYMSNFEDSNTRYLCDFNEDFDLSTTTIKKGKISTSNLTIWKEQNNAVVLGWNNNEYFNNKPKQSIFNLEIPPNSVYVDSSSVFVFSMQNMLNTDVNKVSKKKGLIEFSIVMVDDLGEKVRFLSTDFSFLQERLNVGILKSDILQNTVKSKAMLQSFSFPFLDIKKINNSFNPSRINNIQFVFDKTIKGTIMIDKIGFRKSLDENVIL